MRAFYGYCNPGDGNYQLADAIFKPFSTFQVMIAQYEAGKLSGVVTSQDVSGARAQQKVGMEYLVALGADITSHDLDGLICAASPEQRDDLAALVTNQRPADLKLMTQEQYSKDPTCVDIYVTSVRQPSAFVAGLSNLVILRDLWQSDQTFPAETYSTTFNIQPVMAPAKDVFLWTK